ncbi:hypothetical protein T492DRAFT_982064, partial [Pavlovales sp. CCMP2436]
GKLLEGGGGISLGGGGGHAVGIDNPGHNPRFNHQPTHPHPYPFPKVEKHKSIKAGRQEGRKAQGTRHKGTRHKAQGTRQIRRYAGGKQEESRRKAGGKQEESSEAAMQLCS